MNDKLPIPLQNAQEEGVEIFVVQNSDWEWKLKIEGSDARIEALVGSPVCVFANNGYGDLLFLTLDEETSAYGKRVHEYLHEGPEINGIDEDLNSMLGLKERSRSTDDYPMARYDTGKPVKLGDTVNFKTWIEFWKGWQNGVVKYVPGLSPLNPRHERDGLKWVVIESGGGLEVGPLVDPKTGMLKKIKFVSRANRLG